MDRRLKWWLGAGVLAGHAALLQTLESAWQTPTRLVAMTRPMFTRELKAAVPLTPVKSVQINKPSPHVSSGLSAIKKDIKKLPKLAEVTPIEPPPAPEVQAEAVPPVAPASAPTVVVAESAAPKMPPPSPVPQPSQAAEQASTQAVAATMAGAPGVPTASGAPKADPASESSAEPVDLWPPDTRLSYVLTGNFRGPIGGDAQVQWQRVGARYQVQVDLGLSGLSFVKFSMTSQGQVTPQGLLPLAFEEKTTGRQTLKLGFDFARIHLNDGRTIERPPGVQDTASQFVEFGHRFSSGQAVLEVGKSQQMWLARPNAAAQWTYDIVGQETLKSPRLGLIESYHLKPRPLANPNGPITAELWFAPSLQYLPVRIRINLNTDTWVDLMIDKIEQANASKPSAGASAAGQAVVGPTQTRP